MAITEDLGLPPGIRRIPYAHIFFICKTSLTALRIEDGGKPITGSGSTNFVAYMGGVRLRN